MNRRFREGAAIRAFILGSVVFAIIIFSRSLRSHKLNRGFYYWESKASTLSEFEANSLTQLKVTKLYIKFFEVGLNTNLEAVPISKSNLILKKNKLNVELVPTIFIDNRVFKSIDEQGVNALVNNIIHLTKKRFKEQFQEFNAFNELQIDCDWTKSTKDKYHQFLRLLRDKLDQALSATLRLYPYKFPNEMGVLPVDRAMLMCYNLVSPLEHKNANSILEIGEFEKYIVGSEQYPVPLDIALPVFNNVLVYKMDQLVGLAHVSEKDVSAITLKKSELWRMVIKDTVIDRISFEKGDKLKFEKVSDKTLKKTIDLINQHVYLADDATLSFFQLNDKQLQDYGIQKINSYYTLLTGK